MKTIGKIAELKPWTGYPELHYDNVQGKEVTTQEVVEECKVVSIERATAVGKAYPTGAQAVRRMEAKQVKQAKKVFKQSHPGNYRGKLIN